MGSADDGTTAAQLSKVDLRGVLPNTTAWAETRAAVTASMAAHGYVLVVTDALDAELRRQALFGRALPELYALPFDIKKRSGVFSNGPHRGYDGDLGPERGVGERPHPQPRRTPQRPRLRRTPLATGQPRFLVRQIFRSRYHASILSGWPDSLIQCPSSPRSILQ